MDVKNMDDVCIILHDMCGVHEVYMQVWTKKDLLTPDFDKLHRIDK